MNHDQLQFDAAFKKKPTDIVMASGDMEDKTATKSRQFKCCTCAFCMAIEMKVFGLLNLLLLFYIHSTKLIAQVSLQALRVHILVSYTIF